MNDVWDSGATIALPKKRARINGIPAANFAARLFREWPAGNAAVERAKTATSGCAARRNGVWPRAFLGLPRGGSLWNL
jgi:hypothetical protein